MRAITGLSLAFCITLAVSVTSSAQDAMPGGVSTAESSAGRILVDANGMALYTFDRDEGGASACNGKCAENWPPLAADVNAEAQDDWTIVTREDGSKQWAYKGNPLYTFVNDKASGDVTGDGRGDVWHVATP